jgi:tetratricopeptide (TPR) repeat protein
MPRPAEALRTLEKARALWEELVRRHPTVAGFRNDLAIAYILIGVLHVRANRHVEAVSSYQQAADAWRQLVQADPGAPHYRAGLTVALSQMGTELAVLGRLAQAEEACREALAIMEKLVADFPGVAAWQDLSGPICAQIALLLEHSGRLPEAEQLYRRKLADYRALMKSYPTVARFRKHAMFRQLELGELLWARGRAPEAAEEFRQALALGETLNSEDPQVQEWIAWFLATCADPQFRDPKRAAQIEKKLIERQAHNGFYWCTLGAAYYGMGDYPAAIREIEKSLQFPHEWDSLAWFYLAMAYERLGKKEQARQWYERACERQEKQELSRVEARRIRAEAEQVLGLRQAKR